MPDISNGTQCSINTVSLNIPKIVIPRNSLRINNDVQSVEEIPCPSAICGDPKETNEFKKELSPINSVSSNMFTDESKALPLPSIETVSNRPEPDVDFEISRVVSERYNRKKTTIEVQGNKSLLQSVINAKITEVERIKRSLDDGNKARRQ